MNLFPSFVVDKRRFYSKNSTHLFLIVPPTNLLNRNRIQVLLLGLCLGITLGVALIPLFSCFDIPSMEDGPNSLPLPEPPVVIQIQNPPQSLKSPQNINIQRRPRFYTTELGLRQKLICGIILTDKGKIDELIAVNKTLAGFVNLLFFVIGEGIAKELKHLGINSVVTLSNKKNEMDSERAALMAIKYLGQKFSNNYDFFFIGLGDFYVNGRALMKSLKELSISQDVIWGAKGQSGMCKLESGFILSRSIVRKLSLRLDRCSSAIFRQKRNKEGLEKCFQFAIGNSECSEILQNETYLVLPANGETEYSSRAISIGPVSNAREIYKIHMQISHIRSWGIDSEMKNLQNLVGMIENSPSGHHEEKWPVGLPLPHRPQSRFDVLKWKYFTRGKIHPRNEHETEMTPTGIHKLDVDSVINMGELYLGQNEWKFKYGYRRLDETRGMEYLLDFYNEEGFIRRVECFRPLAKFELVPLPFVTESNRRVTIILPVQISQFNETDSFLAKYLDSSLDKKSNSVLVVAIILQDSIMKSKEQSQFQNMKRMITSHNSNHSNSGGGEMDLKVGYVIVNVQKSSGRIQTVLDSLCSRVLSPNTLVLLIDNFVELKDEFLNRVRMNTILNHQIFSPVPFFEYNPKISGYNYDGGKPPDVHKSTGYFNEDYQGFLSFYVGDYLAARKQANLKGGDGIGILTEMFLGGSQLHFLRSPEPSLKVRFNHQIFRNCEEHSKCLRRLWGDKTQLAKIILKSANDKA